MRKAQLCAWLASLTRVGGNIWLAAILHGNSFTETEKYQQFCNLKTFAQFPVPALTLSFFCWKSSQLVQLPEYGIAYREVTSVDEL